VLGDKRALAKLSTMPFSDVCDRLVKLMLSAPKCSALRQERDL
jgi:hypothetical protein